MKAERYVGLDVRKHQVTVAAVHSQQRVILTPQEVVTEHFESWVRQHLSATDQVALEAITNSWQFHDQLKPLWLK